MLTPRLAQALAIEAHDGQKCKGTQIPYVAHPMAVAAIALEHGANEDQVIAAMLHDAVEDGGAPYAERIRQQFGDRVAAIVDGCTDGVPDANGHKEDWKPRKLRYITHLEQASNDVMLVSGADKLHNARAIVSDLQRIGQAVSKRLSFCDRTTDWSSPAEATRRWSKVTACARSSSHATAPSKTVWSSASSEPSRINAFIATGSRPCSTPVA